jgi:C_GCAxxG_C_C family probable redox protein
VGFGDSETVYQIGLPGALHDRGQKLISAFWEDDPRTYVLPTAKKSVRVGKEALTVGQKDVIASKEAFKKQAREKAYAYHCQFYGCSQVVLATFQELLGMEDELTFKASSCFVGGIAKAGKTCGALLGAVMVLGMKYGREGLDQGLLCVLQGTEQAGSLVRSFEQEFGTTDCREITQVDFSDLTAAIKFFSGPEVEKCHQLVGRTAEMVAEIINEQD